MKNVAVIGECMVEIQTHKSGCARGFGGDTMNTAIYLSRLGLPVYDDDIPVSASYFSAFGLDKKSTDIIDQCGAEGVDMSHVMRLADKYVGLYLIETDDMGERQFSYWRDNSAARFWLDRINENTLFNSLCGYSTVYLSGITLGIQSESNLEKLFSVLTRLRAEGCIICFDSNYRPALWVSPDITRAVYDRMYGLTDMALLTFDDEALLYGDTSAARTLQRVKAFGVNETVIKCGAEACLVQVGTDVVEVLPQLIHGIVDTTAAGDSFNAGYLISRLKGHIPVVAARVGHRLAGVVITHHGAIIKKSAMPTALLPSLILNDQ